MFFQSSQPQALYIFILSSLTENDSVQFSGGRVSVCTELAWVTYPVEEVPETLIPISTAKQHCCVPVFNVQTVHIKLIINGSYFVVLKAKFGLKYSFTLQQSRKPKNLIVTSLFNE